jgi:hypothetical protein
MKEGIRKTILEPLQVQEERAAAWREKSQTDRRGWIKMISGNERQEGGNLDPTNQP